MHSMQLMPPAEEMGLRDIAVCIYICVYVYVSYQLSINQDVY
jgi:hypothetical protein